MIPVQEPLIVYQHFEQQAKSSADMLHSLLTFHCSSRDSLTCENMVSNWCDIAFWTENIRNRSPQTAVFAKIVLPTFVCIVRLYSCSVKLNFPWSWTINAVQRTFRYNIYDQKSTTPSLVRSLSYDPCLRITNLLSIFLTTHTVIFWYASFSTPLSL